MADVHTKAQRSKNMAAFRARYNKSTEIALIKLFHAAGVKGWRRHGRNLPGTPDFVFPGSKTAIFVDGCFWHGCPKCRTEPKTNRVFWKRKIAENQKHDQKVKKQLAHRGWKVMRFWEHQIKKNPENILRKVVF